jgi:hypothetical protein
MDRRIGRVIEAIYYLEKRLELARAVVSVYCLVTARGAESLTVIAADDEMLQGWVHMPRAKHLGNGWQTVVDEGSVSNDEAKLVGQVGELVDDRCRRNENGPPTRDPWS